MKTIFLVIFAVTIIAASQVAIATQYFKDEQFDKAARVLLGSGRSLRKAVLSDPDAVALAKVVRAHIERGYFDDISNVIANTPYDDPVWQTVASTVGSPGSGLYRREHVAPIIRLFRESIHPGESGAQTNSLHLNIDPTGFRFWLATLLMNIIDPKNKGLIEGKLLDEQPDKWLGLINTRYPKEILMAIPTDQSPITTDHQFTIISSLPAIATSSESTTPIVNLDETAWWKWCGCLVLLAIFSWMFIKSRRLNEL